MYLSARAGNGLANDTYSPELSLNGTMIDDSGKNSENTSDRQEKQWYWCIIIKQKEKMKFRSFDQFDNLILNLMNFLIHCKRKII